MSPEAPSERPERLRVLNVIARLSVGGASMQSSLIAGSLDPKRYDSKLACGAVPDDEASMLPMVAAYGAEMIEIPGLGRRIKPSDDIRALWSLIRLVRSFRPHVVHTHTAKAGLLGRIAARSIRPRPAVVHTFHGHVLEGYFGAVISATYRFIERMIALFTDRLVVPSQATANELIRLRIASAGKFEVIHLGLDLDRFSDQNAAVAAAARDSLASDAETLCLFVGRLVDIKRVDVLLEAVAECRNRNAPVVLAIAGDGEDRGSLLRQAKALGIADHVRFLGTRDDIPALSSATDIAVLSSDREGTPVALIEAAASGRPAVSTDAGGVREVVTPETGIVVPLGDSQGLAAGITRLAVDPGLRAQMGERARAHVESTFSADRLMADTEALYERLAAERRPQR